MFKFHAVCLILSNKIQSEHENVFSILNIIVQDPIIMPTDMVSVVLLLLIRRIFHYNKPKINLHSQIHDDHCNMHAHIRSDICFPLFSQKISTYFRRKARDILFQKRVTNTFIQTYIFQFIWSGPRLYYARGVVPECDWGICPWTVTFIWPHFSQLDRT